MNHHFVLVVVLVLVLDWLDTENLIVLFAFTDRLQVSSLDQKRHIHRGRYADLPD